MSEVRLLLVLEDRSYLTGPSIVLSRFLRELIGRKTADVRVVTFGYEGLSKMIGTITNNHIHYSIAPISMRQSLFIQTTGYWFDNAVTISQIIREEIYHYKPTIVHFGVHTWDYMVPVVEKLGVQDIRISVHAPFNWFYRRFVLQLERFRKTKVMYLCVSDFIREIQAVIRPHNNVFTLYNGIDFPDLASQGEIGLELSDISIGFLGSIREEKGLHILLRGLERLRRIRQDVSINLVIQGKFTDNQYESNIRKMLTNLVNLYQGNLRVNTYVFNEDIESFYRSVSVVVVPSIFDDPLPTVVLEALSYGKVVLASQRGGIPELLDFEDDLLVAKSDATLWAERLNNLINNPSDYSRIALSVRTRVRDRFSYNALINKYIKLCDYTPS